MHKSHAKYCSQSAKKDLINNSTWAKLGFHCRHNYNELGQTHTLKFLWGSLTLPLLSTTIIITTANS